VLYLGEINDSRDEAWCRVIEVFDEDARHAAPDRSPIWQGKIFKMAKPTTSRTATYPKAAAAFESGNLFDAEQICLAILGGQANHVDAANLLAIVQCLRGANDEALASFERALAIQPGDVDTLCNRGKTLKDLKRFEEALASYDQALAIPAALPWRLQQKRRPPRTLNTSPGC
jgi:tetratricopeptide (TPR) repeat protein